MDLAKLGKAKMKGPADWPAKGSAQGDQAVARCVRCNLKKALSWHGWRHFSKIEKLRSNEQVRRR
jgi:hypothetical protein